MAKQPGSFRIEQEVVLATSRERAWDCLLDVDAWWTFRLGDASSTRILEPRLGGRFYERFAGSEDGALWGTVQRIERPELVRLEGLLGMEGPVMSAYEFRLATRGAKTVVKLTHEVFGLLDPAWAASHEKGWATLLTALTAHAEGAARPKR
jgi:uncharacterized protein YndB with AHSA1/START domain